MNVRWKAFSRVEALVLALFVLAGCPTSADTEGAAGSGGALVGSGSGGAGPGGAGSESSSSGGEGGAFVDCPKSVANFPLGECDLLNPDCPIGKACSPVTTASGVTTKCVSWTGVKGVGASCKLHVECAAGLFCSLGYCSPPCCPPPGASACDCNVSQGGFGDPNAKVTMCNYMPACELFAPDACNGHPGTQCHRMSFNGELLSICVPPSDQQAPPTEGNFCDFLNDCEEGQRCEAHVCRYSCLVDSSMSKEPGLGGCPAGQACAEVVSGDNIGICVLSP